MSDASPRPLRRYLLPVAGILAIVVLTVLAWEPLNNVDREQFRAWIDAAGAFGPILIVLLMVAAVVASPIPSAPIALAAGAAYGHTFGTALIVAGAEIGACIAFALARYLGRDTLTRWTGGKIDKGLLGSQNALTVMVLFSRLMPFISFDMISYAAGVSRLHFWRFALATLAGLLPASFILAHLGNAAIDGRPAYVAWVSLGLGALTAIPLILSALRAWRHGPES